jgi:hypothetical protein
MCAVEGIHLVGKLGGVNGAGLPPTQRQTLVLTHESVTQVTASYCRLVFHQEAGFSAPRASTDGTEGG